MIYSTNLFRHLRFIIGRNVQNLRTRQRMTLHELAAKSGVPEPKIDHYELGKGEIPLNHALRIACALGVDLGVLIK